MKYAGVTLIVSLILLSLIDPADPAYMSIVAVTYILNPIACLLSGYELGKEGN